MKMFGETGVFMVSMSEDFEGDIESLCDTLNSVGAWDDDWLGFEVVNGEAGPQIVLEQTFASYPTVFLVDTEKAENEALAAAQRGTEPNRGSDILIPLNELGGAIREHIYCGEMTIACTKMQGGNYMGMERLTVRADGSAERVGTDIYLKKFNEKREYVSAPGAS